MCTRIKALANSAITVHLYSGTEYWIACLNKYTCFVLGRACDIYTCLWPGMYGYVSVYVFVYARIMWVYIIRCTRLWRCI